MASSDDELWDAFVEPPASARPRVWWHWMNGNVDEAGIRLDLEWMSRIGVGGAQVFEGSLNTPQLVPDRVVSGSPEWRHAIRTAATIAEELDLELTVATSAGWSAAGAPWVEPADAMKKIVWSETVVEGGRVSTRLPDLPSVAGAYQEVPRWGRPPGDPVFSRDSFTLAVPAERAMPVPAAATASTTDVPAAVLIDGTFGAGIELPRDLRAHSTEWIVYRFDEPVLVAAVTVGIPAPRGFGTAPPVLATLESSDDGIEWVSIVELPASQAPARSRSFSPVISRWFRLRLDGAPAAGSIPPMDDGVLPLPFPPPPAVTHVTQFALWAGGRVSAAEEKAGFGTSLDYSALDSPDSTGFDPADVLDVTAHVANGVLDWDAPQGRWRILRFGFSLTGHQNGPAPAEATGLEVDKLDSGRVRGYLERWLGRFKDTVGPGLIGEHGIVSLLSDSIESGPQNWTENLPEEFRRRRGYDLVPWMPALAGWIVRDAASTDRMLWDFRQTIAELHANAYYSTVAAVAHEWGLTYYAEALEDHRPQLGDDLLMRSHADVPMGAMWAFSEDAGPAPTYVADLRGASSVAHVHGKAFTGAESMSSFGRPYLFSPRTLKPIADLELALGVTRFCIHTSPHQPSSVRAPGIALTPHLGQTFTRHETWAELAAPWIDYLARACHLLNLGTPVADVAFFAGEEAPLTAIFGDQESDDVPPGFAWDFVSADALASALSVDPDGMLVSAGEARYRVLYLGGTSMRMTLATLRRIAGLVAGGATVVGSPPSASPSAADDPLVFNAEVAALWSSPSVVARPLADVLGPPDWEAPGLQVVHRSLGDTELYFVRNPTSSAVEVRSSLRTVAAGAELWDPVTLNRTTADARVVAGRTALTISLPSYGSVFVVLRTPRRLLRVVDTETLLQLDEWHVDQSDDPAFSGTATWSTEVEAPLEWFDGSRLVLRLQGVHDIAQVFVGGRPVGITWTEPFEVDLTGRLEPGTNTLDIAVTNTWANRLIADAADPESATTQLTAPIYAPDAPMRPWGLRGPATLLRHAVEEADSAYS